MNIENVKRAIAVMERVKHYPEPQFNMSYWVHDLKHWYLPGGFTEKEAVSCGTSACFLGWVALAEDIPEIFFDAESFPMNQNGFYGVQALEEFLEIPLNAARGLCGLDVLDPEDQPSRYHVSKYGTPQDVIDKLELLIEDESQS